MFAGEGAYITDGSQKPLGTSVAAGRGVGSVENAIREVRLQGQHYFSIALGGILATGSVAMLMHGPRAADARAQVPQQREAAVEKPGTSAPVAAVSNQR